MNTCGSNSLRAGNSARKLYKTMSFESTKLILDLILLKGCVG